MLPIKIFLLAITISSIYLGIKIRRSNLGWVWFVGFATIAIFGLAHSISMSYFIFANEVSPHLIWVTLLGNLIFLGTLIFQSDGGDGGNVIAIDQASGNYAFGNKYTLAWRLTGSFVLLFIAQNIYLFSGF